MSVYTKLMNARLALQSAELKKSGNNRFASYSYFELADFLPTVQGIFLEQGLCGVVSFGKEEANLTIVDIDNPADRIVIGSPMADAQLKGCHPIQNLGAVQTYLRRYLWVTAMEIVEHDALDAVTGEDEQKKKKPASQADAWDTPKPEKKIVAGNGGNWNIKISDEHDGQGWPAAAKQGAEMALEFAKSADDVLEIFKTNRVIFDQLKEADAGMHAELMDTFKKAKERMK
jgi:ERF superfamily